MLLFYSLFICRRNSFPSMSDHLIASEGVFTDFFTQQIDKFTGSLYTIRRNTAIGGEHCFPFWASFAEAQADSRCFFMFTYLSLPLCPPLLFCPSFRILGTDYACFARRILMPHVH